MITHNLDFVILSARPPAAARTKCRTQAKLFFRVKSSRIEAVDIDVIAVVPFAIVWVKVNKLFSSGREKRGNFSISDAVDVVGEVCGSELHTVSRILHIDHHQQQQHHNEASEIATCGSFSQSQTFIHRNTQIAQSTVYKAISKHTVTDP